MATPAGDGAEQVGMPQLDFATFPSQIFWLAVAMVALYYILSRVALPRIAGVIEERYDAIEDDLERAADYRRRAEEAEKAYQKALEQARGEAQRIAAETRATIQERLDEASARAEAEIAARAAESEKRIAEIRARAAADVETIAAEAAEALVEAIAPGAVEAGAARAAVSARLGG